ncbi:MAG: glycosyltransferase [Bacteroidales bacterium]|nr:glycosyltransferase [Bacteroidales bacterium]
MSKFSVVSSVYRNDKPEFVRRALDSITVLQSRRPDEVVLVVDGPVPDELSVMLDDYQKSSPVEFNIIRLPENKGLGNALKIGVEAAKYEIIARMDSDDVSVPDRFEKQIGFMERHPDFDVVGGQISEFIDTEENIVGKRIVPCGNEEISMWLKGRCPFNHVSVSFLRSRGLAVGNYQDWHFNEDYYLWIRMAQAGYKFANLPDVLVNVRVGRDMYARRGGWKYFKSEAMLQRYMLDNQIINRGGYLVNTLKRLIVQVLLPNSVRAWVFKRFAREH